MKKEVIKTLPKRMNYIVKAIKKDKKIYKTLAKTNTYFQAKNFADEKLKSGNYKEVTIERTERIRTRYA